MYTEKFSVNAMMRVFDRICASLIAQHSQLPAKFPAPTICKVGTGHSGAILMIN